MRSAVIVIPRYLYFETRASGKLPIFKHGGGIELVHFREMNK